MIGKEFAKNIKTGKKTYRKKLIPSKMRIKQKN